MNRSTVTPVRTDAHAKKIWTAPVMEVVLPDHAQNRYSSNAYDGVTIPVYNFQLTS